ncbi:MAG: 4-hydroxythreonine-4-phosphate dehydrogenase PdxA [Gammaproteobacteria bacterium]|nr:4-hydroxythreonine-4-phosphate dehydrogenase PdxA [Gammaproteobacteria bacterium]
MTLRIAVTPGEPAGIGPDLLLQLIQNGHPHELVAYTDPEVLTRRAALLGLSVRLRAPAASPAPLAPGELAIAPLLAPTPVLPGRPNRDTAAWVLDTVRAATLDCLAGRCAALVTGPLHKAIINDAGIPFSGHTELLAELTGTSQVVMMLATTGLRVALVTTHLPLAQVPAAITRATLTRVIEVLHAGLEHQFAIPRPRILVCGLNPHAGEGGHLGREEIDVLVPVLEQLRTRGLNLVGPLPADTLFTPGHLADADAVLAMYHDQGLPVLKHMGFGRAANITLGLPMIRTSVDHGTALELVGTGTADAGSLRTAIDYAVDLALRTRR